ncbi:MAG TPA: hypothetical protein VNY52_10790, partial [Solirubrobacteraceae bacterium]|nr:hypothetical protein [Solirubrobacteraceae bacterium]
MSDSPVVAHPPLPAGTGGSPASGMGSSPAAGTPSAARPSGTPLRLAFLGPAVWLDCCAPERPAGGLECQRFDLGAGADVERALAGTRAFGPDATVVFDPPAVLGGVSLSAEALRAVGGATLGVLVGGVPEGEGAHLAGALDRLVSFDPALTGAPVGGGVVWRAVPPSLGERYFQEVRPLRRAPRGMSIGRSTEHREAMLMPAKHHHDLLQVIHGVSGARLGELLGEYDVGVYIPREPGGGFGWQVGAHLAAGQLLLTETLRPGHGLECDIDYLKID